MISNPSHDIQRFVCTTQSTLTTEAHVNRIQQFNTNGGGGVWGGLVMYFVYNVQPKQSQSGEVLSAVQAR